MSRDCSGWNAENVPLCNDFLPTNNIIICMAPPLNGSKARKLNLIVYMQYSDSTFRTKMVSCCFSCKALLNVWDEILWRIEKIYEKIPLGTTHQFLCVSKSFRIWITTSQISIPIPFSQDASCNTYQFNTNKNKHTIHVPWYTRDN